MAAATSSKMQDFSFWQKCC